MTERRLLMAIVGLVALLGLSGVCLAGEAEAPSEAAAAYETGKTQLRGDKPAEALATFRQGLAVAGEDLGTTWKLLLGAALASEKLDRGADAIEYYRRFLNATEAHSEFLTPKWRDRRVVVNDAVDELQQKLNTDHGYLTISSQPESAAIFVNGARAGVDGNAVTPFGIFVAPGTYELRLELEGYEAKTTQVTVEVGKLKPLSLTLVAIVVPEPEPEPEAAAAPVIVPVVIEQPVAKPASGGGLGTAGWVTIGSGGAMVLGGVVCTVMAGIKNGEVEQVDQDKQGLVQGSAEWKSLNDRHVRLYDDFTLFQGLSGVFYGVGAAAIATGLVLVILDSGVGAEESDAAFGLTPTVGGAYGQATLRF